MNSWLPMTPDVARKILEEDDAPLREAVSLTEGEKFWATDDRAKFFASGGRGLLIVQGYAREHALKQIVWERRKRRANWRRHRRVVVLGVQLYQFNK